MLTALMLVAASLVAFDRMAAVGVGKCTQTYTRRLPGRQSGRWLRRRR